MTPIETSFTKLLGIKSPIVAAPMAGASGVGALAAEVTLGGGFGFMSAGYDSLDDLRKELSIARNLLHPDPQAVLSIGVGFLGWQLDKFPSKAEELLSVTMENHVQAIWLSFGHDIGRWVKYVRDHDPNAGSQDAVKVFIQISTLPEVQQALNEWKADVIVAQGNEAGGHGLSNSLPILALFPLLAKEVSAVTNGPPLLAAGGLAIGAHIAALLTLGASGVVLGTRFLLSPESRYTDSQRKALLDATSSQSVRTMAFDHARNTLGWPQGIDGRGLRNDTVEDYERGEDINVIRQKFAEGVRAGDNSRNVVWAGSGVGFMSQIKSAKDIVRELHEDCVHRIKCTAVLLSS